MKLDTDWRQNTAKESMREIRKHLISELVTSASGKSPPHCCAHF
jgi:hypothetical protein